MTKVFGQWFFRRNYLKIDCLATVLSGGQYFSVYIVLDCEKAGQSIVGNSNIFVLSTRSLYSISLVDARIFRTKLSCLQTYESRKILDIQW